MAVCKFFSLSLVFSSFIMICPHIDFKFFSAWYTVVPTFICNVFHVSNIVVVQSLSCVLACNLMDCSTPGPSVLHYLPGFAQIQTGSVMLSKYYFKYYFFKVIGSVMLFRYYFKYYFKNKKYCCSSVLLILSSGDSIKCIMDLGIAFSKSLNFSILLSVLFKLHSDLSLALSSS